MARTAADARQTTLATGQPVGTPELAAVATADAGDAILATGTAKGPLLTPPEPQLPLASQPPPPGSCGMKCVIPVLVPEPAVTTSAEAIGAAATAVATAPATNSVLKGFIFANMPVAYHPNRVQNLAN